jgi:hypothetical protein
MCLPVLQVTAAPNSHRLQASVASQLHVVRLAKPPHRREALALRPGASALRCFRSPRSPTIGDVCRQVCAPTVGGTTGERPAAAQFGIAKRATPRRLLRDYRGQIRPMCVRVPHPIPPGKSASGEHNPVGDTDSQRRMKRRAGIRSCAHSSDRNTVAETAQQPPSSGSKPKEGGRRRRVNRSRGRLPGQVLEHLTRHRC